MDRRKDDRQREEDNKRTITERKMKDNERAEITEKNSIEDGKRGIEEDKYDGRREEKRKTN